MDSIELFNINNPQPESILNTKYLDADYLFGWLVDIFHFVFRQETLDFFYMIFVFLSLFFITLIIYCAIRLLEIRRKEHEHLQYELWEYREHHAKDRKTNIENAPVSHNMG